ncbi:hypothetical protein B4117_0330 [Bacillus mycoides]|nr:hypothetical protein B4117_0330 [Bacillus mycoides]
MVLLCLKNLMKNRLDPWSLYFEGIFIVQISKRYMNYVALYGL